MRKNLNSYMNRPQTKVIILTLTNNCNLSCVYCYEHNKEARCMKYDTAEEIIMREMTAEDGSDFVCIYYFGGEPFTAFETIKRIHSFLRGRSWSKKWFTFCTTNGTLVHDEIQDWLIKNDDTIEIYISIDGTEKMHNANRSGSYGKIDVNFFAEHYPFAKMTITQNTLPELADGVIYLHSLGFEVSANIGHGICWDVSSPMIFAEQLDTLINYYCSHPEYKPANILDIPITELEPGTETPRRFCGVGPLMRSYDTEGEVYPCHAFAPLCIGKERAEEAKKLDFSSKLKLCELDEKCSACPIVGHCPTCYGINFGMFRNVYHVPEDHCKMMKVQFMAGAKFKFQLYKAGRLHLTPEEEVKFLRNIISLQKLSLQ